MPTRLPGPEPRLTYERLLRLQAMTAALSSGMTQEQIGEIVLQRGLDLLEFSAASVSLLRPDGTLEVFAHRGYAANVVAAFGKMAPDAGTPLVDAVRTRAPVFLRSREVIEATYPRLTEHVRASGNHAMAAVPMLWEDGVLGGIGLSFAEPRSFLEDERDFLLAVAQQCAMALMRITHFSIHRILGEMTPDELLELRRAIDVQLRG